MTLPHINGARGAAMFFFGIVSATFGIAFHSPWAIIPPPPRGLEGLDTIVPLEVWGIGWYIAAGWLIIGAFRQNQAKAMGVFAFMLFVWFASYLTTAIGQVFDRGHTTLWFAVVIYGALLGAVISVARLLNAPSVPPMTGELKIVVKETGDDS